MQTIKKLLRSYATTNVLLVIGFVVLFAALG